MSAFLLIRYRRILILGVEMMLVIASNYLAFWLRFDGPIPMEYLGMQAGMVPMLLLIRGVVFMPFRLYEGLWRYTSVLDLRNIIAGVATSSVVFYVLVHLALQIQAYPRSVFLLDSILLVCFMGGIRLGPRVYREMATITGEKRVLVFGAGDAGEMIVRDMKNHPRPGYQPVGFVDDDPSKIGRRIHGLQVLGTRDDLPSILKRFKPQEILIAMPHADEKVVRSIVRALEPLKIPIKTLPNLRDIIDGRVEVGDIRSLAVEDLLPRAPVGLDQRPLQQLISGHRVMVTGAGGSIGAELCRQIARLKPASLVMFDRYENSLHTIRMELQDRNLASALHTLVGDITDSARVHEVLRRHQPEIIFHAAAHKHVPLMEESPCEAIKNNVRGTRLLAQAAQTYGAERFVFISTDKAVKAASVMGASKRVAEMVVQSLAAGSGTSFAIVRFGNVLGSNGSVVPRFMDQIRRGGPVTITHPDMRRFFMLIPEAVQLVLHAASQAESGATYVLEMGEPVKMLDMARDLIRLSGLVPDEDIKIEFTGVRPGEKLEEELVGPEEDVAPSRVDRILRVCSRRPPADDLFERVQALENAAAEGQTTTVIATLKQLGAGFDHDHSGAPATAVPAVTSAGSVAARAVEVHQRCPKCLVGRVVRSRARTILERTRKEFTMLRPFRCDDCGWRGWLTPLDVGSHEPLDQPPAPDLDSLDSATAHITRPARPDFYPRHLN